MDTISKANMDVIIPETALSSSNHPLVSGILQKMRKCMRDYGLSPNGQIVVGLSGGKDSTILTLLLRDLGYSVVPAIVDLGYANFPGSQIADAAQLRGFEPAIIKARDPSYLDDLDDDERARVQRLLEVVSDPSCRTPCGPCSQIKRSALELYCRKTHSVWVGLGHHREDFVATILKDYFVTLYYREIGKFVPARFAKFVTDAEVDVQMLRDFVEQGLATTMAVRLPLGNQTTLFRPMAYVPEHDIECLRDDLGVSTFGSGCAHEVYANGTLAPVTKREMVLHDLRNRLLVNPGLGDEVLNVALNSLTADGLPKADPRKGRVARFPGFDEE